MNGSPKQLVTVGEIARRTGAEYYKVDYAIQVLGVKPSGRAGHLRVFDESDVGRIREFLEERKAPTGALATAR